MATNRLEILKSMVEQDPKNSFARYGLAMEYAKEGELPKAIEEYRKLMDSDADYAAAYFHAGQTYEKLGQLDEARDVYQKGIEVTTRKGDAHTRAELEAALNLLPI